MKKATTRKVKKGSTTTGRSTKLPPVVGVIMGSQSDYAVMLQAVQALELFNISCEVHIVSAHRTPHRMAEYAQHARDRGLRVIIAGAGGAAHLPGMVASLTTLPVIGVPVPHGSLQGEDALLSIVQMPKGVPVATVAIGGAWNAGILAAQILSLGTGPEAIRVADELLTYKDQMAKDVPDSPH
jgi:5-(carboxyamino)imidazole ribonucleotide mutase